MEIIDLSEFFTTKSQANDFSARLTNIAGKIYEVNFSLEKNLQEELGIRKKDKFLSLLRENKISPESNSALNNFINQLIQTISSLPVATLTLAIEPEEVTLKIISDWFLLNLKKQVLIDIQVDSDLIAGAIVNYQGRHFNASLKTTFDELYTNSVTNKPIN
jgi:F0F1-type ATP synthase delta subunit